MDIEQDGPVPPLAVPEREPVVIHVHRELRNAILRGQLKAGARMVETQLSAQLNVSRTPVREAISRLEAEGLVIRKGNGGVLVAEFGQKLEEVMVIRQSLECAAVQLACRNATDTALAGILRHCREAMRAGETDQASRSQRDRAFHIGIAEASGSLRLRLLIEEFYEYSFAAMQIEPTAEERRLLEVHHLEIASALVQRDAAGAEETVRAHFAEVNRISRLHLAQSDTQSEGDSR